MINKLQWRALVFGPENRCHARFRQEGASAARGLTASGHLKKSGIGCGPMRARVLGALLIAAFVSQPASAHFKVDGILDPMNSVGAPSILFVVMKPTPTGNSPITNGIPTVVSAFFKMPLVSLSGPLSTTPNMIPLNFSAPDPTLQLAASNTRENWSAKNNASESPSENLRFTPFTDTESAVINVSTERSSSSRHETVFFNFSVSSFARSASLWSVAAFASAAPAASPAAKPAFEASAILPAVSVLNRSSSASAACASLLCANIDPAVATPTELATSAVKINDTMSTISHHSPLWPRNKVEEAALALLITSASFALFGVWFGIWLLCEVRRSCRR